MRDHTYRGSPVSKMSDQDLHECLNEGFRILDDGDLPDAKGWITLRLQVEVIRRKLGIAIKE